MNLEKIIMKQEKIETISNLFEGSKIRSVWDNEKEEYYFSVVDVVNALANPKDARKYQYVLKKRLKKEGSEMTKNCSQLKMLAPDGKMRLRDAKKRIQGSRLSVIKMHLTINMLMKINKLKTNRKDCSYE